MTRWVLLVAVALLVAACQAGDEGAVGADVPLAAGDVASGRALTENNCAGCHGADLRGTASGPPLIDLVYEPSHHGDEAFRLAVARGAAQHHWDFGPMPAIGGLDDQDVIDIIAYVRAEQRAAGIE